MLMHKITKKELEQMNDNLKRQPEAGVVSRAVQENGINNVARNPKVRAHLNRVFSVDLDTKTITNQKHAGLCWMFATLNFLRHYFSKKYHVKDFELSSNYLFFWDKIERANVFYDHVIETAKKSTYDRALDGYLRYPDDDGGEWDMAVSLIEKYGLMPASAFPRTSVANNTDDFAMVLGLKLRRDAVILRHLVQKGKTAELKSTKTKMMDQVYRMVSESLGVPPEKFDLEYRDDKKRKNNKDKDANYHLVKGLTPLDFYHKYFKGVHLDDYVPVGNYPDKKMNQLYRQKSGDNVEGGKDIHFLNLPMSALKKAAIKQMKDGWGVWFGNDVMQQEATKKGYLDDQLYQRGKLFNVDLDMTKRERFVYKDAMDSHAMTLTGVDLVDGKPKTWKVENSWGSKVGESGYFVMNDGWMNKYVYEVIVNKKYLTKDQQKMLHMKPIELKPWE
ncbi:C1 family peptidase [uncultured bacterium]|uniref:Aminopeptidase n=2 Tax=Acetilactobacillus jinshanensis TaxID=1720083 RepID=A0A4P6ZM83_9LACO|nr:aminopeptidase [Acetilactobacillus jinshanensis]URL60486.1 C1 family peptidase [uncultured bacterium]